ncbi:MAG: metal ABC transporter permease [bacterium]|nr:metal ABC transporter permease [bacterium]
MIGDFLAAWPLFQDAYLSGFAIAVLLSWLGLWVVARGEIFLGAAVSQASTLGIALAFLAGGAFQEAVGLSSALAVVAAAATALLSVRGAREGRESGVAITGWVFLLASSVPTLLLAHDPHGVEEIHRLAFSTLLGAQPADPWILLALAALTGVLCFRFRDTLFLLALDPEMAAASGVPQRRFEMAVALWLGVGVGLSMRVSGLLFTFGCLVLPALAARNLSPALRPLVWSAPLLALAVTAPAFVVAHAADTPPAHTAVAGLCALVLFSWLRRR